MIEIDDWSWHESFVASKWGIVEKEASPKGGSGGGERRRKGTGRPQPLKVKKEVLPGTGSQALPLSTPPPTQPPLLSQIGEKKTTHQVTPIARRAVEVPRTQVTLTVSLLAYQRCPRHQWCPCGRLLLCVVSAGPRLVVLPIHRLRIPPPP